MTKVTFYRHFRQRCKKCRYDCNFFCKRNKVSPLILSPTNQAIRTFWVLMEETLHLPCFSISSYFQLPPDMIVEDTITISKGGHFRRLICTSQVTWCLSINLVTSYACSVQQLKKAFVKDPKYLLLGLRLWFWYRLFRGNLRRFRETIAYQASRRCLEVFLWFWLIFKIYLTPPEIYKKKLMRNLNWFHFKYYCTNEV